MRLPFVGDKVNQVIGGLLGEKEPVDQPAVVGPAQEAVGSLNQSVAAIQPLPDLGTDPNDPMAQADQEELWKKFHLDQASKITGASNPTNKGAAAIKSVETNAYITSRMNDPALPLIEDPNRPELSTYNEFITSYREGLRRIRERKIAPPKSFMEERARLFPDVVAKIPTYAAPAVSDMPKEMQLFALGRILGGLFSGHSLGDVAQSVVPQAKQWITENVTTPRDKRDEAAFQLAQQLMGYQQGDITRQQQVADQQYQKDIADQGADETQFTKSASGVVDNIVTSLQKEEQQAAQDKRNQDSITARTEGLQARIAAKQLLADTSLKDLEAAIKPMDRAQAIARLQAESKAFADLAAQAATRAQVTGDPEDQAAYVAYTNTKIKVDRMLEGTANAPIGTAEKVRSATAQLRGAQVEYTKARTAYTNELKRIAPWIQQIKIDQFGKMMDYRYAALDSLAQYRSDSTGVKQQTIDNLKGWRDSLMKLWSGKWDHAKIANTAASLAYAAAQNPNDAALKEQARKAQEIATMSALGNLDAVKRLLGAAVNGNGDEMTQALIDMNSISTKSEFTQPGSPVPKADAASGRRFTPPVDGPVTGGVSHRKTGEHMAYDYGVPFGSTVRATGAGRVLEVGEDHYDGRYVVIDHGNGLTSKVGHLGDVSVGAGQDLAMGEPIAVSGKTGVMTGPNVHIEFWRNGQRVNPSVYIGHRRNPLPPRRRSKD